VIVVGDPGGGKTALITATARHLANDAWNSAMRTDGKRMPGKHEASGELGCTEKGAVDFAGSWIPLQVDLDLAEQVGATTMDAYLAAVFPGRAARRAFLAERWHAGRLHLLIDGGSSPSPIPDQAPEV